MKPAIAVTTHSVRQWLARASTYGNEDGRDLLKVFKQSKKIECNEYMPCQRRPGFSYYYSSAQRCYFVVDSVEKDVRKVVTVVTEEEPKTKPIIEERRQLFVDVLYEHDYLVDRTEKIKRLLNKYGTAANRELLLKELNEAIRRQQDIREACRELRKRINGSDPETGNDAGRGAEPDRRT